MGLYARGRFTRSLPRARAHVRYIAFRSREIPEDRLGAFNARSDHAEVKTFMDRLEDPLTRHPQAVKAYTLFFSLSQDEFRRAGLESWKPVIREAMATLQTKWGREFDWIAAEHMVEGHPHCHVTIKAVCTTERGTRRQLRLTKERIADLKQEVGRIISRERDRHQELTRKPELGRGHDLERAFLRALDTIAREEEQANREAERYRPPVRRRPARGDDRGR